MADMVKNKIICKKEIGDKVLSSDETGRYFDFNLLIPMAEELNISGYDPMLGLLYYLEKHPEKLGLLRELWRRSNFMVMVVYQHIGNICKHRSVGVL